MIANTKKAVMAVLCAFLLVWVLPLTAFAAEAVTVTDNGFTYDDYLTVTAENGDAAGYGKVEISGGTITIYAKRVSIINYSTTTVTVKNTSGGRLTVSYTDTSGTATSKTLENDGSFTQSYQGSKKDFTSVSFEITGVEVDETKYSPTFIAPVGGTYTVDDVGITADTIPAELKNQTTAYALRATANASYSFYGWLSSKSGRISTSNPYDYYCAVNESIKPLFYPTGGAIYYVPGDASGFCYYPYLDTAITVASSTSSKQVVVAKSGTVYTSNNSTDITIPAGITLLIPYSASDLTVKSGTSSENDFKHANVSFVGGASIASVPSPTSNVLYTLTIPSGTTVTVAGTSSSQGRIVVGGTILGNQGSGDTCFEGGTYGAHSNLVVDGTLNLGDYSVLSATGYVLGGGTINTTGTGAEVYQPMVFHDWRGGNTATLFVDSPYNTKISSQTGESQISPFSQWTAYNIRPQLTITYGNKMYYYASVYDDIAYCSQPLIVGTDDGLIQLQEGATLTSKFEAITWSGYSNGYPGRNNVTISGGATLGTIGLNMTVKGQAVDFDSNVFTLHLCYAYAITLDKGDYYVDKSIALLPGSSVTVLEKATLHLGETSSIRFMVFDGLVNRNHQENGVSTNNIPYAENTRYKVKNYPTTKELQAAKINGVTISGDAELIVDGTLVIGQNANMGGVIQTNGTGVVDATAGTAGDTIETSVQIGVVGQNFILAAFSNFLVAGSSVHEMNAQVVSAATGERFDIVRGVTYSGSAKTTTQTGYSFKYYPSATNTGYVVLVGDAELASGETLVAADGTTTTGAAAQAAHPLNETINGGWLCQTHTGVETDHICDVCGYVTPHVDADTSGDGYLLCDGCSTPLAKLGAVNVSADSTMELSIKLYMHADLVSSAKVEFAGASRDDITPTQDAEGRYVFTVPVASGYMTKDLVISFEDAVILSGDTNVSSVSASVARYIAAVKNQTTADTPLYNLVDTMSVYGDCARIFFADTLTDIDTYEGDAPEVDDVSIENTCSVTTNEDIGIALSESPQEAFLDAAIRLRVYFTLNQDASIDDYSFHVQSVNGAANVTAHQSTTANEYYIDILNIPAAYLDEEYTITVKNSDGKEYVVKTSVLAYLADLLADESADENQKRLAKAMYYYNDAANEFDFT